MREWSYEEASNVFPQSHRTRPAHGQRATGQYESQWATIAFIAGMIGCTAETLGRWVRQNERNTGQSPSATSAGQQQIKVSEREGTRVDTVSWQNCAFQTNTR